MTTLVYVHGTNGSGKSTLARAIIREAGGVKCVVLMKKDKASYTQTNTPGIRLVGSYANPTGGVDGLSPYAAIHNVLNVYDNHRIFAEGLVTPGIDTCKKMASYFDRAVFIALDVPLERCIMQVLKRRKAAGNIKPYSPDNLYRKAKSVASWANRLEAEGLDVRRLDWMQAYYTCLEELGLPRPRLPL